MVTFFLFGSVISAASRRYMRFAYGLYLGDALYRWADIIDTAQSPAVLQASY